MRGRAAVALALILALAGCGGDGTAPTPIDRGNALEIAARDAHIVSDPAVSPVGLYERRHGAGVDSVCVAGEEGDLRFGIVASFGTGLVCEGRGAADHSGERLRLRFAGADCVIDAGYDGETLRLPGAVAEGCAALCGPRASLSGVSVERVGWADGDARRLRSRRDAIAGRAPRPLCGG